MGELSVVGKSVPRIDALEKVTGKAVYCSDIKLPRLLHAKVLRSPHPHARIVRINTSKAEKIPGVKYVLTGKDVPDKKYGLVVWDRTVLAQDAVRFVGDPVAAVVGESLDVAEEALGSIEVKYEQLPAVFDPEEAMSPNPPVIIHPELFSYPKGKVFGGPRFEPGLPNVFFHARFYRGDTEKGFKDADLVLENRFSTARIQHAALEPHDVVVRPEVDGGLTMWVGRQNIWRMRDDIGALYGISPSKIRVIQPYVGGAFGGKVVTGEEMIAVLLALKTLRPVKLVFTREEVFTNGGNRVPMVIYIKDGVKKDGTFVARQIKAILSCGAYESNLGVITRNCAFGAIGTYRVPNFKWDSYGVYVNEPPACSYRGLGSTQVVWAVETQIDMLAEKLGIDAVEMRRNNILKEGEPNVTGEITHSIGVRECLDKMAEFMKFDSKTKLKGPWRKGKGIALGNKYSMAPTQAVARVKVLEDESIEVYHSADENGQGCNTVAAQIAAEEFGVPADKIRVIFTDTLTCPFFAGGSSSSRVTYNLGNAVRMACHDAKRRLFRVAANRLKLDVMPEELATKGGEVYVRADPRKKIKIAEVFLGYRGDRPGGYGSYAEGGEIIGTDTWIQDYVPEDPETGQIDPAQAAQGKRLNAFWAHTAKAVEVAVNVETGQIKILRCGAATDMGQPINPKMCEQQAEGGMVMGIGDTIYEEMQMKRGIVTNPNFTDYRIPSVSEIPKLEDIESMIAGAPHKDGPYGAKGFGEGAMIGMEPAIGNAIYNAVGVRFKDLPISCEGMLKAMKQKGG